MALADVFFLFADARGSIVLTTRRSGSSSAINTYDEYGVPGDTNSGRFGYTGQTWVPELGLWYYKARMYSPTLGRFMQTDPIGYGDGMNMYAYVGGDPVNWVDPTGLKGDGRFENCRTYYNVTHTYFDHNNSGGFDGGDETISIVNTPIDVCTGSDRFTPGGGGGGGGNPGPDECNKNPENCIVVGPPTFPNPAPNLLTSIMFETFPSSVREIFEAFIPTRVDEEAVRRAERLARLVRDQVRRMCSGSTEYPGQRTTAQRLETLVRASTVRPGGPGAMAAAEKIALCRRYGYL